MLCEVTNALYITYIATEYLVASTFENDHNSSSSSSRRHRHRRHHDGSNVPLFLLKSLTLSAKNIVITILVVLINIIDRFHISPSTASAFASAITERLLHVPRIVFAATAYIVALYVDCKRVQPSLPVPAFFRKVGVAFIRVAPAYPFLAVLISFVFLFVISAFEKLHLPLEYLNMPIYYGTLYGPFSVMYWMVKKSVMEDCTVLPMTCASSEERITNTTMTTTSTISALNDSTIPVTARQTKNGNNPVLIAALKRRQGSSNLGQAE